MSSSSPVQAVPVRTPAELGAAHREAVAQASKVVTTAVTKNAAAGWSYLRALVTGR